MECEEPSGTTPARPLPSGRGRVMRLFDMAQIAAARIVDMRNALPLLQFAHFSQAKLLQDICVQVCPSHTLVPTCMLYMHVTTMPQRTCRAPRGRT